MPESLSGFLSRMRPQGGIMRRFGKVKVVRNAEYNEWVVKCWDTEGKRWSDVDYFTDNKQDAIDTAAAAMQREKENG